MSVKVNLLPSEIGDKSRAGSQRAGAGLALVAVLAGIGGVWFMNTRAISTAEDELAAAEAEVLLANAELGELQPFQELQQRALDGQTLVSTALGQEVSVASILQDFSAVLPPNVQIQTLSVIIVGESSPVAGGQRLVVGRVNGDGQLLLGIAPGAERLLIDLDRAAAFENVFVTTTVDDAGIVTFTFDLELGLEVLTRRYGATLAIGGVQ